MPDPGVFKKNAPRNRDACGAYQRKARKGQQDQVSSSKGALRTTIRSPYRRPNPTATMRLSQLLLCVFSLLTAAMALHFEIEAGPETNPPTCIRDFVSEGQLVVVNIVSSGSSGDGQKLNFFIRDSVGNEYRKKNDFSGEVRVPFVAHASAAFDVCFVNVLQRKGRKLTRHIELDIEAGSAARDWNAVQAAEKLKPVELELRKVEELTDEIVGELEYLKAREERLRDTNESTNRRVRNFSICTILALVAFGSWQITYLRNYFKSKHII